MRNKRIEYIIDEILDQYYNRQNEKYNLEKRKVHFCGFSPICFAAV